MKPVIRDFFRVVRRYKLAVALNVLGLSVAFAAFMVIMTQVHYDFSFDRFHKDYDKIFRVEPIQNSQARAFISRPLAEAFFESSHHILAGAITDLFPLREIRLSAANQPNGHPPEGLPLML